MRTRPVTALIFYIAIVSLAFSNAAAQGIITSIAGNGVTQYIGDGWPATNYSLSLPKGMCLDASGNVYVADYLDSRIRKIDVHDTLSTIADTAGHLGHNGDGFSALDAAFDNPAGICLDTSGNMYISEEYNDDVRKINKLTGVVTTVCGSGAGGYFGDGGPATAAHMERPAGLCVDKAGNIYIADYGNLRVRKVDAATGEISTYAGNGMNGYTGDNGPATNAKISYPKSVCVDTAGNLYIADYGNNCIRRVDATTGIITTVAGTGTAGYTGDNGLAVSATLRGLNCVFMSKQGILYISDFGNNVVRAISPEGFIFTIAGTGVVGYSGDNGPALSATFRGPLAVCADDMGYVYVADGENSAIRKITPMTLKVADAMAQNKYSVYPNPSNGRFTVRATNAYKNAMVAVYSVLGEMVYTNILNGTMNNIDVSMQSPGVYYLSIMTEQGRQTQKIIIAP